jgi:protein SHQ1
MAKYDISSGELEIHLPKMTPGEVFTDLDMISKLLSTKPKPNGEKIQIISEEDAECTDDESIDWQMDQEVNNDLSVETKLKFGFNSSYSDVFIGFDEQFREICSIPSTDMTREEILLFKQTYENQKFDPEYFQCDCVNDGLEGALDFKPIFKRINEQTIEESLESLSVTDSFSSQITFTDKEREMMISLAKKEFILDSSFEIYRGLLDILLAYCYESRITGEDFTVESGWCISQLCSSISCLYTPNTVEEVIESFLVRSITIPLYRNWKLSTLVLSDVKDILSLGRRAVLKVLLNIKNIFEHDELRYLVNKFLIDDYCIWIQKYAKETKLRSLMLNIPQNPSMELEGFDWDIEKIQSDALEYKENESELDCESLVETESESNSSEANLDLDTESESVLDSASETYGTKKKVLIEEL